MRESWIIELFSLLYVILVALLVVGAYTSFSGVSVEQVWLTTSDGVQLNAKVYKQTSTSETLPGVIVCHGLSSSLEMMQSAYSLEFAKRGFLVVAIDLRGHGSSGGSIGGVYSSMNREATNRSMFEELMFSFFNETELEADVKAAVDYLLGRSDVVHDKVAVLGHSMGGAAVLSEGYSDLRVRSVVAIAPALSPLVEMNLTSPRNLLLAVGARDNIVREESILRLFRKTTGGGEEIGKLYGNFSEGNARKMIVSPGTDHVGEMLDTYIAKEAIAWVEASLGVSPLPIALSPWINLILPLSVSAAILSAFPAVLLMKLFGQNVGEGKPHTKPLSTSMKTKKLLLIYLGAWGISGVLSLRFDFLLSRLVPIMFADMFIENYITFSIIILSTAVLLWGTDQELRLNLGSKITIVESAILSVLGFLVVFSALNITFDRVFINLYPSARRLLMIGQLFFLLLPPSLMDEILIRNFQNRLSLKPWQRIGATSILSLSLKLLILAFASFIFGAFIGLAAALLFIPALCSAWLFENSGSIAGGTIFSSLFMAWIMAAILPFVHGYLGFTSLSGLF